MWIFNGSRNLMRKEPFQGQYGQNGLSQREDKRNQRFLTSDDTGNNQIQSELIILDQDLSWNWDTGGFSKEPFVFVFLT